MTYTYRVILYIHLLMWSDLSNHFQTNKIDEMRETSTVNIDVFQIGEEPKMFLRSTDCRR